MSKKKKRRAIPKFVARFLVWNPNTIKEVLEEVGIKDPIIWKGRPMANRLVPIDGVKYYYNYIWLTAPMIGDSNTVFIHDENMVCVASFFPFDIDSEVLIRITAEDVELYDGKYKTFHSTRLHPSLSLHSMFIPGLTSSRKFYMKLGCFNPGKLTGIPTIPKKNRVNPNLYDEYKRLNSEHDTMQRYAIPYPELVNGRKVMEELSKENPRIKTKDPIGELLEKHCKIPPRLAGNRLVLGDKFCRTLMDPENDKPLRTGDIVAIINPEYHNEKMNRIITRQMDSLKRREERRKIKEARNAENARKYKERLARQKMEKDENSHNTFPITKIYEERHKRYKE